MLAITGAKGGCGKTTTTLGLAGALARAGLRPLAVDADCDMPDLHHRAVVPREPGVDSLASGAKLGDAVHRSSELDGVSVLPAGRRQHLESALRTVNRWRGPVLIDCAAGVNPDSLLPLRYADAAVVVSTDRPQCLEDAMATDTAARQLDRTPIGVIIRETDCQSSPPIPDHMRTLARIPSVEDPLSQARIRELWAELLQLIISCKKRRTATARKPE